MDIACFELCEKAIFFLRRQRRKRRTKQALHWTVSWHQRTDKRMVHPRCLMAHPACLHGMSGNLPLRHLHNNMRHLTACMSNALAAKPANNHKKHKKRGTQHTWTIMPSPQTFSSMFSHFSLRLFSFLRPFLTLHIWRVVRLLNLCNTWNKYRNFVWSWIMINPWRKEGEAIIEIKSTDTFSEFQMFPGMFSRHVGCQPT